MNFLVLLALVLAIIATSSVAKGQSLQEAFDTEQEIDFSARFEDYGNLDPLSREVATAVLLREWTERAPEAAFAFAIDRDLGHLCAKAWGELHPATVESAVAAYLDRQGRSDVDRRKLLDAVASGVVLKEPAPAIAKWKAQAPRKLTPRMVRA